MNVDRAVAAVFMDDAFITHPRHVVDLDSPPEPQIFQSASSSCKWVGGSDLERKKVLRVAKEAANDFAEWCAQRGVQAEVYIVSGEAFGSSGLYLVTSPAFESPEEFASTIEKYGIERVVCQLPDGVQPSTTLRDVLLRHDLIGDVETVAERHRELLTMALHRYFLSDALKESLYLRCENLLRNGAHYSYKKGGTKGRVALDTAADPDFKNPLYMTFNEALWEAPGASFVGRMLKLYVQHDRVSLTRPVITMSHHTGNQVKRYPLERAISDRDVGLFTALLDCGAQPAIPTVDFYRSEELVAKAGDLQAYLDWIDDGQELAAAYRAHCMRAAIAEGRDAIESAPTAATAPRAARRGL